MKKIYAVKTALALAFLFLIALTVGLNGLQEKTGFAVNQTFYLLCEKTDGQSVSAVAGSAYSGGGAGYILLYQGNEEVALAVYAKEEDAKKVSVLQEEKGKNTQILPFVIGEFYCRDLQTAKKLQGEVNSILSCVEVFFQLANGLERGEISQEEGKSLLIDVEKVLQGLQKDASCEETAAVFARLIEKCQTMKKGILFSKDARYMQLMAIDGVAKWAKKFSL